MVKEKGGGHCTFNYPHPSHLPNRLNSSTEHLRLVLPFPPLPLPVAALSPALLSFCPFTLPASLEDVYESCLIRVDVLPAGKVANDTSLSRSLPFRATLALGCAPVGVDERGLAVPTTVGVAVIVLAALEACESGDGRGGVDDEGDRGDIEGRPDGEERGERCWLVDPEDDLAWPGIDTGFERADVGVDDGTGVGDWTLAECVGEEDRVELEEGTDSRYQQPEYVNATSWYCISSSGSESFVNALPDFLCPAPGIFTGTSIHPTTHLSACSRPVKPSSPSSGMTTPSLSLLLSFPPSPRSPPPLMADWREI